MNRRAGILLAAAAAGAAAVAAVGLRTSPAPADEAAVTQEPFSVWAVYEGRLEARRVELVMSTLAGSASLVELAPEGASINAGDLLARFDDAQLRRELLTLERDYALAESALESLINAKLPLELQDLALKLAEADQQLEAERQFLADSEELQSEGLLSPLEVAQQAAKVDQLRARREALERQQSLTERYLHPAEQARAEATLEAARQALALAREQLSACVVEAPVSGRVAYLPLHIGSEYRTARVGDTIFRNQPLLSLPDMSDVVVHCQVPEAELARVAPGAEVVVVPVAYPDLRLNGRVETVSTVAQRLPDQAAWQKFFRVVVALEDPDPRLRSGMSVYAQVLSYYRDEAVLVPRVAVEWRGEQPRCRVRGARKEEVRSLVLGPANATHYQVIEGLEPGEWVVVP